MLRGADVATDARLGARTVKAAREVARMSVPEGCNKRVRTKFVDAGALEVAAEEVLKRMLGFEDDIMAATIAHHVMDTGAAVEEEQGPDGDGLDAKSLVLFLEGLVGGKAQAAAVAEGLWARMLASQPEEKARKDAELRGKRELARQFVIEAKKRSKETEYRNASGVDKGDYDRKYGRDRLEERERYRPKNRDAHKPRRHESCERSRGYRSRSHSNSSSDSRLTDRDGYYNSHRHRSRSRGCRRSRSRGRHRSRSRSHGRHRTRSRSHDRHRTRSRSHDRHRTRSRSHDRHRSRFRSSNSGNSSSSSSKHDSNWQLSSIHSDSEHMRSVTDWLIRSGRLALAINLDHTLVHSTCDVKAGTEFAAECGMQCKLWEINFENQQVLVVVRPGAVEFLREMARHFDLCAYTCSGSSEYAQQVAEHLDPSRKLFGPRIVALTDDPKKRTLEQVFPVHPSMLMVADASDMTWKSCIDAPNVLTVRPFRFFPSRLEPVQEKAALPDYDPAGESKLREKNAKRAKQLDHGLFRLREILLWVHDNLFPPIRERRFCLKDQINEANSSRVDVRCLALKVRQSLLPDFAVVIDHQIERHHDVKTLLEQCGAIVLPDFASLLGFTSNKYDQITKIVIADSPRPPLAQEAKNTMIPVVSAKWVFACVNYWTVEPKAPFSCHE